MVCRPGEPTRAPTTQRPVRSAGQGESGESDERPGAVARTLRNGPTGRRCVFSAVQVYFLHNPQMTFGQRMTLGGQTASGNVRSNACESFGAVFGALAPLREPQIAVQI